MCNLQHETDDSFSNHMKSMLCRCIVGVTTPQVFFQAITSAGRPRVEWHIRPYQHPSSVSSHCILLRIILKTYFSVTRLRLHMVSKTNRCTFDARKLYFSIVNLPQWWCIVGNDDQFSFALTQCFERLFISQAKFAGFHDQSQTSIGALQSLFLLRRNTQKILVSMELNITSLLHLIHTSQRGRTEIQIFFHFFCLPVSFGQPF